MIADYYPPEQRSSAMGIFTLGISFGIMIAYLTGGWVVENIGWREAFLIVGIPGLVLAALMRLTVVEPRRGMSEARVDPGEHPSVLEVARFLVSRKSFIWISLGAALSAFGGYAVANFFPSFLVRSHGMSPADIGVYLGLVLGIAGGIGLAGGGVVADRFGRRSQRHALLAVASAMMIGWLFNLPVFTSPSLMVVLVAFTIPAMFSNFALATTFANTQGLVGLRMRGVASALMLFILNIIGLGLGPQMTGILSDLLRGSLGDESMRYALLIVVGTVYPLSALCYFLASRTIDRDLARAEQA
jgi:predicted MFS family arabinose efflux permease